MAATVLVVEDEPAIQELIAYNLKQAGHQPLRADNAEQAIRLVQEALPDLVLLDWMLPGLSGIELARRLRASAPSRSPSSCSRPAPTSRTVDRPDTGADDYITKPFSPRELNAASSSVAPPCAADDR
jgi:two-component system phosphate regulon response regulator PhoB